ncbi:MAG: U32 family peptidase [Bacteroidales bacterium]|nr:U32 family peptidase [Bacteroidales bacterium]
MTDLELLAPARNADIGIAAIDCGADAVYIAGPSFGARQNAGNSMEDVRRLCEYAHLFGARIFLTLNTILYDNELPDAERMLAEAAEAGVDAIIAQDLAVFEILRCAQNDIKVHASTQCAIRTPQQAKFYESLGASRLVLERQLSLEQIKAIREAVSCELEFFIHGALCVCYSGQCYMSEAIEGRSANRGACIQACRSLYDLEDGNGKTLVKDKALLSLKDYNLIERLGDLAGAGICSFKIEGRLKGISYVRNVVRAYSEALDDLVAKHPGTYRRASFGKVEGGFKPDLGKTFNRNYTELFLDGKKGMWSSMDSPKSVGEPIGSVISISAPGMSWHGRVHPRSAAAEYGLSQTSAAAKVMELTVRLDDSSTLLHNGDGFSFVSKDHNSIVGFRGDTCRGAVISTRAVPELYVGARIFRNLDTAFEKDMEANLPKRLIPVRVSFRIIRPIAGCLSEPGEVHPRSAAAEYRLSSEGTPAGFSIFVKAQSLDGRNVEFEMEAGEQEATNVDRMKAMFKTQIEKTTGRYSFTLESLEMAGGKLPFLPASAINGIRREIAAKLDSMTCKAVPLGGPAKEEKPFTLPGKITYKSNISNKVSESIYRKFGAASIEKAFELSHQNEAELMRSKYCIRHELGLCLKDPSASGHGTTTAAMTQAGPLYLVNNGKRYRLGFDCAACEMTVSKA